MPPRPSQPVLRLALLVLLMSAGYYLCGLAGLRLRLLPDGIGGVWLPHGILVAALLIVPPARWPWCLAASLAAHLLLVLTVQAPRPLAVTGAEVVGTLAQAALAAALLRPFLGRPPRIDNLLRLGAFVLLGTFLAPCLISAALTGLLTATGWEPRFWPALEGRVLAQGCSAVVVTLSIPLMLLTALVHRHEQAVGALRTSQRHYRSVVEDQTELVCRFLRDGTYTFVNGAYGRCFQRAPADLIGQSFWQFIPEDQHASARSFLESLTPERPVATIEHPVLGPGGEVRWQQWTDRAFFDGQGRVVEYQAVGRDITERKRAQDAVEERENQLRLFVQHAPAAVAMFDRSLRYLSYSQRWLTDYKLGEQSLVGRSHYEVFPEIPDRWREIHRRCLEGAIDIAEDSFARRDGTQDWIRWEVRPWHNARQEIGGIVMFTEVITEQKRAQDERRQLLAEKQVAEALREVDRRKDEFLAMLAHELRNPLAPIAMAVELLRLRAGGDESVAWARDVIGRQTSQLTRLVDDLLDVSRVTLGKIRLDLVPLDLRGVVHQAVESTRPLLVARQHELLVDLPDHALPIRGDGVRLVQVVANLLNNAAKYTRDGGRLAVGARLAGGQVVLSVADNGIGIARDMLERVFEMFTQLGGPEDRQGDRQGDRSQGGLGIGLALVKRLVEMHGGAIEARSAGPGRGSEFVVRLERAADEPAQPATGRAAPEGERDGQRWQPAAQRKRILIVDDNVDAAETLSHLLRLQQHEVQVAHDGLAGLAAAQRMHPDVVLLDLGLPRLSGLEVARRLRQSARGSRPLLVATTGFGQSEDRARTAAAGFDHHLTKPVDPQLLQSLVQTRRAQS